MSPETVQLVGLMAGSSVLTLLLGKLFDLRAARAATAKTKAEGTLIDAEAAKTIAETAVVLVAPLKVEISELTSRVATLETENAQTKTKLQVAIDHINKVHRWIAEHIPGMTPPQPPDELGIET
ncbi:hypothetical protein GS454_01310 [Rhodococcus hoagii]|nr:hypothetical protein [Prescottella equi]